MGYSYRWMRGLDYNSFPEEMLEKCSPIRCQLLGDGHNIKVSAVFNRISIEYQRFSIENQGLRTIYASSPTAT